jgi:hypothetical protein
VRVVLFPILGKQSQNRIGLTHWISFPLFKISLY